MARHASLAACFTRFLTRPLVSRAFRMRGLAPFAGNLTLLLTVHRGESAILFSHAHLPLSSRGANERRREARPAATYGLAPGV
jgi:hypothetical protein